MSPIRQFLHLYMYKIIIIWTASVESETHKLFDTATGPTHIGSRGVGQLQAPVLWSLLFFCQAIRMIVVMATAPRP